MSKTRRQWDARIGRWLSIDPSRQFYSSYLGMGNNPVIGVDPDGRYSRFGAWWRSGFSSNIYEVNGEWGYNTVTGNGDGINVTFNVGTYGQGKHTLSAYEPNFFGRLASGINSSSWPVRFLGNIVYSSVNDLYLTAQLGKDRYNLDGRGAWPKEITNAGVNTLTNFNPFSIGGKAIGVGNKTLNASQFSTMFQGTYLVRGPAQARGQMIRTYNETVIFNNSF